MGILLRHPDLAELADQDVTYPEVGATAGDLPDGYRPVVRRAALGHGQATFQRCATALMTWEVHRASGIEVWASHSPAQPGTMVSQRLGLGPLGIVAPCKVVYVVEEADRRGFAYGTCPGIPSPARSRSSSRSWTTIRWHWTSARSPVRATCSAASGGPCRIGFKTG